ncbi:MAG: 1,4-alpha-glucan-branching enzyme, partial [Clostridia bacterium]|nr:1,4-alpha-glucan-branching enzyme [Clostridia bacterium]
MSEKKLNIILDDPSLAPYEGDLNERVKRFNDRKQQLLAPGQKLSDFANGHHYYGFHKVKGGWVYREWAPNASAMHLVGDFNGWNHESHPMKPVGDGNWEIEISGVRTLPHESKIKVAVTANGRTEDRILLYANYVKQDKETNSFNACI